MECASAKVQDECDSPQIELSSKYLVKPSSTNESWKNETWKGGYFHTPYFVPPPIYQYPYAEWVPNSICYADYSTRMKTFEKWPKQMKPSADELIFAGFFYKGYGDSVECFFCGVTLHDWETKDNAINKHKKWSKSCKYVDMISNQG